MCGLLFLAISFPFVSCSDKEEEPTPPENQHGYIGGDRIKHPYFSVVKKTINCSWNNANLYFDVFAANELSGEVEVELPYWPTGEKIWKKNSEGLTQMDFSVFDTMNQNLSILRPNPGELQLPDIGVAATSIVDDVVRFKFSFVPTDAPYSDGVVGLRCTIGVTQLKNYSELSDDDKRAITESFVVRIYRPTSADLLSGNFKYP